MEGVMRKGGSNGGSHGMEGMTVKTRRRDGTG